ncbi:MAG: hypothetical protein GY811_05905 [Myxococcales bacterium]|nr:hypothetical protein [Myxococcales bacterium]
MNEVQESLADAFEEILEAFGVDVTINGQSLQATMSQNEIAIEDADAGFMKSASIDLKFLFSSLSSTPAMKDPVVIDGETYAVVAINRKPSSPIIVCEVEPA